MEADRIKKEYLCVRAGGYELPQSGNRRPYGVCGDIAGVRLSHRRGDHWSPAYRQRLNFVGEGFPSRLSGKKSKQNNPSGARAPAPFAQGSLLCLCEHSGNECTHRRGGFQYPPACMKFYLPKRGEKSPPPTLTRSVNRGWHRQAAGGERDLEISFCFGYHPPNFRCDNCMNFPTLQKLRCLPLPLTRSRGSSC